MNREKKPWGPKEAGFTLLEVIIATVLLSVMMTLLMGGMRIGADSWEQGERLAERASRMMVVDNFFRSHLSDVKPLTESVTDPRQAGAPPRPIFGGGPVKMEYAGTLPPQVRGGIYKFRLYWVEQGDRSDLKLAMRPFSADKNAADEPIEDLLVLENVESLHFSYFKKGLAENESLWMDDWSDSLLPSLIRIEITVRDEPPWPPILVAPRVELAQ